MRLKTVRPLNFSYCKAVKVVVLLPSMLNSGAIIRINLTLRFSCPFFFCLRYQNPALMPVKTAGWFIEAEPGRVFAVIGV